MADRETSSDQEYVGSGRQRRAGRSAESVRRLCECPLGSGRGEVQQMTSVIIIVGATLAAMTLSVTVALALGNAAARADRESERRLAARYGGQATVVQSRYAAVARAPSTLVEDSATAVASHRH